MKIGKWIVMLFSILVVIGCPAIRAQKKTSMLTSTPPMGWNSWNTFQTHINDTMLRQMVDTYVASGMRDAGYRFFVLDDGWMSMQRNASGQLEADPKKFPAGMKSFADYVHAHGLKFGIYNCAGTKTCAGYPGTRGHEYEDARLYASWGVDFLKYDWCYADSLNAREAYITMRSALDSTGRPIVFSICEWGGHKPWLWAKGVGELYRTTGDIAATFSTDVNHGSWTQASVLTIAHQQQAIRKYNGPNHWNDPDMLEVGNGMTVMEDRAHFSIWCMLAAPLSAGNDLRKMTNQTKMILTDKDLIAVDQDSLGIAAFRLPFPDSLELWVKPLANRDFVLCILNPTGHAVKTNLNWNDLHLSDDQSGMNVDFANKEYTIRDLWMKKDIGKTKKVWRQEIGVHDVVVLRLTEIGK